jgi:hypothetical protein
VAQVFLYQDKLAEIDARLRQFEAKIDYISQRLSKGANSVIAEDLSVEEIDEYEELLSRFELLKQWEAVEYVNRWG